MNSLRRSNDTAPGIALDTATFLWICLAPYKLTVRAARKYEDPFNDVFLPRGAVKTAHLRALENRTRVGGHFQNRTPDEVRRGKALPA